MTLTKRQCELLLNMVNGSLTMLYHSGIPIATDTSKDIDIIKAEITKELIKTAKREGI